MLWLQSGHDVVNFFQLMGAPVLKDMAQKMIYSPGVLSRFSPVGLFLTSSTIGCRFLCPRDSPGKNIGVGCRALPQGSNPQLLRCLHSQAVSLPLVPPGKPKRIPYNLLNYMLIREVL